MQHSVSTPLRQGASRNRVRNERQGLLKERRARRRQLTHRPGDGAAATQHTGAGSILIAGHGACSVQGTLTPQIAVAVDVTFKSGCLCAFAKCDAAGGRPATRTLDDLPCPQPVPLLHSVLETTDPSAVRAAGPDVDGS